MRPTTVWVPIYEMRGPWPTVSASGRVSMETMVRFDFTGRSTTMQVWL